MTAGRAGPAAAGPEAPWLGLDLSGGRYHIIEPLGEGGAGIVYRARDRNLDADVVIEVPRPPSAGDPGFSARFIRAIRLLARLTHPHLAKVTDVGEYAGLPFAVVEYLCGGSLKFRRPIGPDGRPAPMPAASLTAWLPDVAGALDFLHAQGKLHRDVRPANIQFDAQGRAYLSGLGMAEAIAAGAESEAAQGRATADAHVLPGAPGYMAPEQILGQPADGRADQYALAAIVYEVLSGRPPFEDRAATAVLVQQATREPPELHRVCPAIPEPLSAAVQRGLSRDPRRRYPDCKSFARAVTSALRCPGPSPDGPGLVRGVPRDTAADFEAAGALPRETLFAPLLGGVRFALGVVCSAAFALVVALARRSSIRWDELPDTHARRRRSPLPSLTTTVHPDRVAPDDAGDRRDRPASLPVEFRLKARAGGESFARKPGAKCSGMSAQGRALVRAIAFLVLGTSRRRPLRSPADG